MPIGIDRFEEAAVGEAPTSVRVLWFLLAHDDQAYTRSEIAEAIDVTPETVGTNLTRLKDRNLVRHREPYWALTDDRDRAVAELRDRLDDRLLDRLEEGEWAESEDDVAAPEDTEEDAIQRSPASPARPPSEPHREAARDFADRVRDRLDDAIDALYLFGSVARGTDTAASDVDVLVVVADDADYAAVDDRLLDVAYDVQLEYDVPVEVHSIRASEFADRRDRGEPFVRTVVEEGELGV